LSYNISTKLPRYSAIEDVSFKSRPARSSLSGPNGAGKSTTVKIITGMLRPNDGRVLFEGQDIAKDMVGFRAPSAMSRRSSSLHLLIRIGYLQLVGRLRGLDEALIETKATRLLKLLNLESWQYSPISTYSKGMRQRVLIAASCCTIRSCLSSTNRSPASMLSPAACSRTSSSYSLPRQGSDLYLPCTEVVEQSVTGHRDRQGPVLADAHPGDLARLMSLPILKASLRNWSSSRIRAASRRRWLR